MIMTKISDDNGYFFKDTHTQTRTYSQMPVKIILISKLNPLSLSMSRKPLFINRELKSKKRANIACSFSCLSRLNGAVSYFP